MSATDMSDEDEDLELTPGARPFVKWSGGKTQILPALREWLPRRIAIYTEPFVGGGALFFDTQPRHAYLSDANPDLVAAYTAVRDDVDAVIDALKIYADGYAKHDSEKFYYHVRATNPNLMTTVDRAAWMIFLNKTGFNGLFRVNATGKFNVPFGKRKSPNICDEITLRACSAALQRATIVCKDFREVNPPAGSVLYCDSPYHPLSDTSDFTSYTKEKFTAKDQTDLRDLALRLKKRGVYVLLSNSNAPLIRDLYHGPDFEIREVQARRNVNADGAGRGAIAELLIR